MRRTALPALRRCRALSSLPALSASLSDPQLLRTQCYVDGKWCGGGGLEVLDPASGAAIASVPDVGAAEAERAVRAAHAAVKAAQKHKLSSEMVRIVVNLLKVMVHLYAQLHWCMSLPGAMDGLLAFASVFAVDLFTGLKLPCLIPGFSYYTKVKLVVSAQTAAMALVGLVLIFAIYPLIAGGGEAVTTTVAGAAVAAAAGCSLPAPCVFERAFS